MDITAKLSPTSISDNFIPTSNIKFASYPFSPENSNIITTFLIIDSGDRDWYSQIGETPTNFTVKLGDQSISNHNCNIKLMLRNIMSLRVDKLFMPNRIIATSYDSNTAVRLNDNAFLTVQFDRINDVDLGTNLATDQGIAIMTSLIPLPAELSNITNLEFKNANNQNKIYYGSPKASLDRLDTHILTATGEQPHNFADVLVIDRAFSTYGDPTTPLSNTSITLRTNTYFNSDEYKPGDLIKIQGYSFHNNTNNECFIFNNYINRVVGHRIIGISSNTASTLYNQIHIPTPQYYSTSTGVLTYESWYSDFLTKNNFTDLTNDSGGKLINTNLQTRMLVSVAMIAS
jgi:hypothetical protein